MPKRTMRELIDDRADKKTEADTLMKSADKEKRSLSTEEAERVDTLIDEVTELSKEVAVWEKDKSRRETLAKQGEKIDSFRSSGPPKQPETMDMPFKKRQAAPRFRDAKTGEEIRAYLPTERIGTRDDLSAGRFICGVATGNWNGSEAERRALEEGTNPAGGYLLNPAMSANLIDLARAKATVFQAGALTIPMTTSELKIARLSSDVTASWKAELANVTESDPAFEQVTLTVQTLCAATLVSIELLQDAANMPSLLEHSISEAIALELDRTVLRGQLGDSAGGPTPTGIRFTDDVVLTNIAGAYTGYDQIFDAMDDIETNNGTPNARIMSVRENATERKLKDGDSNYLPPPPDLAALNKFVTTQIPINLGGGSDESEIYVGDFTQVAVGMRTQVTIEASRDATINSQSAFEKLGVWIRAYLRADVVLLRANHFHVMHGITG